MGLRKILDNRDETLRKKCRDITKFDRRLQFLLNDLADTMKKFDGVGLAAPQVGVMRRACVVNLGDEENERIVYLVNPEITFCQGEQIGPEGCLSVPNRTGLVKRPKKITVNAQDEQGKPFELTEEEFNARALCHEIDHLDGKLYTDIVIRYMTKEEAEEWEDDS
ncbi:MAG: peptide deformylase [Oscillospiraceae bacterium]|nr:peptide deformylase [Oscillospiraceae bacterium]